MGPDETHHRVHLSWILLQADALCSGMLCCCSSGEQQPRIQWWYLCLWQKNWALRGGWGTADCCCSLGGRCWGGLCPNPSEKDPQGMQREGSILWPFHRAALTVTLMAPNWGITLVLAIQPQQNRCNRCWCSVCLLEHNLGWKSEAPPGYGLVLVVCSCYAHLQWWTHLWIMTLPLPSSHQVHQPGQCLHRFWTSFPSHPKWKIHYKIKLIGQRQQRNMIHLTITFLYRIPQCIESI